MFHTHEQDVLYQVLRYLDDVQSLIRPLVLPRHVTSVGTQTPGLSALEDNQTSIVAALLNDSPSAALQVLTQRTTEPNLPSPPPYMDPTSTLYPAL